MANLTKETTTISVAMFIISFNFRYARDDSILGSAEMHGLNHYLVYNCPNGYSLKKFFGRLGKGDP